MKPTIRPAKPNDTDDVLRINRDAFGGDKGVEVADLVAGLLADPTAEPRISLLAFCEGEAVGHILFTPVQFLDPDIRVTASVLAPLAVVPLYHSRGIGGSLIVEGLSRLKVAGVQLVFVLGHPGYYPRHGFLRACPHGFFAPYQEPGTPNDAWMVQELVPGALESAKGGIKCANVLNEIKHWRE